jgi:hypothetical protein
MEIKGANMVEKTFQVLTTWIFCLVSLAELNEVLKFISLLISISAGLAFLLSGKKTTRDRIKDFFKLWKQ